MRTPLVALVTALLLSAMPLPLPPAQALPTPGLFCDAGEQATGRLFPEPMEANDFVSYDEARCGLDRLVERHPDRIRLDVVTQSVGWSRLTGGRDTFDVYVVRVSDYAAGVPLEEKKRLVFQLSIHGNEKGGREGGLRVIEDLVRGVGMAQEHPALLEMLGPMELLFVFPNPDGWTHEELEYRHNDACYASATCRAGLSAPGKPGLERQNFVRYNGNGVDVNREWPTVGWVRERHTPMSEPEAIGLVAYLKNLTNVVYASDIHGMLNPADGTAPGGDCASAVIFDPASLDPTCFENAKEGAPGHFVLTMLPGGRQDPREMMLTTTLAEHVKETLNRDPFFAEWRAVPGTPQGWWGGEFNDWGTVWDTLGYTDSGFTSDFYAQDQGLDAPGVDFEYSYNHVYFDNYYAGPAQRMNAYHVQATRDIVRAFMEKAAEEVAFWIDGGGRRTAWVESPVVVTNEHAPSVTGWAAANAADDAFDRAHRTYRASANDYWHDLRAHLRDGELRPIPRVEARALDGLDNLVVAGSAYRTLADDAAARQALRAFVERGGTLLLTDEAIRLLADLGVADAAAIDVNHTYAGHTNFVDEAHALVADVRGLARQTYEPVPLGYNLSAQNAPVWHVERGGLVDGVEVVGVAGAGQGAKPDDDWVDLGVARVGQGRVVFLGALLPDPKDDDAAFYGVDGYATTYTGNQLVRNALGWTATTAPADSAFAQERPEEGRGEVPAPAWGLAMLAVLAVALAVRRRPR